MLRFTRKQLIDSKDAIMSFMSKDLPVGLALTSADIYEVVLREMRSMELHNLSQLAKYGKKNDEKHAYEMDPTNPNYQIFLKERNEFLNTTIEVKLDPIYIYDLELLGVKVKPFEVAELRALRILTTEDHRVKEETSPSNLSQSESQT